MLFLFDFQLQHADERALLFLLAACEKGHLSAVKRLAGNEDFFLKSVLQTILRQPYQTSEADCKGRHQMPCTLGTLSWLTVWKDYEHTDINSTACNHNTSS
eukprot:m.50331 g.50331  ORF g.50331 m.50331 type:complete len:101 (+) comp34065_c0_seq2:1-303(+)